jgi:tol-pal system protein YbgF
VAQVNPPLQVRLVPLLRAAATAALAAFGALGAFAALAALGACARTAEERHLDDMREEIERLQVDRDRADEHSAQPESGETRPAHPAPRASAAPTHDRSDPSGTSGVQAIGGPSEGFDDSADTEDKTPRPSIRVAGSPRSGRYGLRQHGGDDDQVQQTPPDSLVQPPLDPEAKRAYDAAIALVNARQYDKALDALAAFLVKWPEHPYADNAMYWRGECYFAKGDWARASEQFEGTVTRYPAGNKVPDALLKLGLCSLKLGNPVRAKAWFDRLAAQFPQSEPARRIPPVTVPATTPAGPAEDAR